MSRPTRSRALQATAGALAILALCLSPAGDQGFPLIVLLGPLVSGAVAAGRGASWRVVAAAWALAGALMLAVDWIVNGEDRLFHLVLIALMAGLTALGAATGRAVRRMRRRPARTRHA